MNLPIFHLAFPIRDVQTTVSYYREALGFEINLIESKRCIINFFGHQAVAHVSEDDVPKRVSMYPRHFGVILSDEKEFDQFYERAFKVSFLSDKTDSSSFSSAVFQRLFTRFEGTPREHKTFFLKDPSNNLLEFKWYRDPSLIYKSHPNSPPLSK